MRARDLVPASMPIMVSGPAHRSRTNRRALARHRENDAVAAWTKATRGNSSMTRLLAPIEGDPGFGRMVAWGGLGTMNSTAEAVRVSRQPRHRRRHRPSKRPRQTLAATCSMSAAPPSPASISTTTRIAGACSTTRTARTAQGPRAGFRDGPAAVRCTDCWKMDASPPSIRTKKASATRCSRSIARPASRRRWKACSERQGSDVWPIGDPWRHRVVGVGWTEDLPKQQFFDAELAKISRGRAAAVRRADT